MREPENFHRRLAELRHTAAQLNEFLQPIVEAEVDLNQPLTPPQHPADESGLRTEITAFFESLIELFLSSTAEERGQLRALMEKHHCLMYSAVLESEDDSVECFRKKMVLFVIDDQGRDTRDAILLLGHFRKRAEQLGIDYRSVFKEMASLASDTDKYGMGSTRALLLRA